MFIASLPAYCSVILRETVNIIRHWIRGLSWILSSILARPYSSGLQEVSVYCECLGVSGCCCVSIKAYSLGLQDMGYILAWDEGCSCISIKAYSLGLQDMTYILVWDEGCSCISIKAYSLGLQDMTYILAWDEECSFISIKAYSLGLQDMDIFLYGIKDVPAYSGMFLWVAGCFLILTHNP